MKRDPVAKQSVTVRRPCVDRSWRITCTVREVKHKPSWEKLPRSW